jgi:hypothetical protein
VILLFALTRVQIQFSQKKWYKSNFANSVKELQKKNFGSSESHARWRMNLIFIVTKISFSHVKCRGSVQKSSAVVPSHRVASHRLTKGAAAVTCGQETVNATQRGESGGGLLPLSQKAEQCWRNPPLWCRPSLTAFGLTYKKDLSVDKDWSSTSDKKISAQPPRGRA